MNRILSSIILAFVLVGCAGQIATEEKVDNPNCVHRITHTVGSWVLSTPTIRFVFWGKYWASPSVYARNYVRSGLEQDAYQSNWQNLISNGVFDRLAEYTVENAVLDPHNYNTNQFDDKTTSVDDGSIPNELNNEIMAGALPVPNNQSIFVVFLPPNVLTPNIAKNNWGAYHSAAIYGNIKYTYAVIRYTAFNQDLAQFYGTNIAVSHELYEAFTNPDGNGYFEYSSGNEIGDLCQGMFTTIDGIDVQKVYSGGACKCL
jgi:hypothetical protein